jgi:crotonobetainyl-CoA:carnitine CoA-transferase CaiB-like acyl-CoA transferase
MLIRDDEGNLHIGNPIRFQEEPARIDTRLPALGEHTGTVLAEIGHLHAMRPMGEEG